MKEYKYYICSRKDDTTYLETALYRIGQNIEIYKNPGWHEVTGDVTIKYFMKLISGEHPRFIMTEISFNDMVLEMI